MLKVIGALAAGGGEDAVSFTEDDGVGSEGAVVPPITTSSANG
jgi:hypothetical protein